MFHDKNDQGNPGLGGPRQNRCAAEMTKYIKGMGIKVGNEPRHDTETDQIGEFSVLGNAPRAGNQKTPKLSSEWIS